MRRRGAWPIGMGGGNCFLSYYTVTTVPRRWRGGGRGRLGSPRPLGLPRPGRTGLPASCGAGEAGRRPCASPCAAAPINQSVGTFTINYEKNRFSRSEASSGRIYKCTDGSRGGTAHHLPVLLAKVNRHSPCLRDAQGLKAQLQLGGPTPFQKRWLVAASAGSTSPAGRALHSALATAATPRAAGAETVGLRANPTAEKKTSEAP